MKLAIIIPSYNESQNIPLIVSRLRETIGQRSDVEVILVDNGSTDNSQQVLAAELNEKDFIRSIHVPVNQGYGYGILSGLAASDADVLAWTHADMQTDPYDVIKAFDLLSAQADAKIIVKGKRQNRKKLEEFFTFGMQLVASMVLGVHLSDVNAQPKVFTRPFYETFVKERAPHDFSLDLFLLYQAVTNGYKILEVPVFFAERRFGEAKGGGNWKTRIKLIRRTFAYIFEFRDSLRKQD
ncbi:glycosyltransferase family 2 protein [Martelella sp. HB161492]|uniref:glycosyltransferase family 2 protein n=1 Tax=Martelella sp. HB161492 TaxID=2720726 RepID=UPI00159090AC|nr:glycosyltransferase family 2 protein [Martelella sp. HB161492]